MIRMPLALAIACTLSMMGCASTTQGTRPTMTITGPADSTSATGLPKSLIDAHNDSFNDRGDAPKALKYLESGLSLVRGNCTDFFKSAGESQKWIGVNRDVIVNVGTIGSAVLALHSGSRMAAGNLALFTGLSNAGLDIYTKNFLFAAENVSSVETLVLNALAEHKNGVLALAPFTYESATNHILDNQSYCMSAKIAALARDAIKNGRLESVATGGALAPLVESADASVLRRIGGLFNLPGPVSADHAGGFWWLLNEFSTLAERKEAIAPKLANLPTPPVDANGAVQAGWPEAAVRRELGYLSATTVAGFRKSIKDARDAATAAANFPVAAPAPGAAAAPPMFGGPAAAAASLRNAPAFQVPVTAGRASDGGHVTVQVR